MTFQTKHIFIILQVGTLVAIGFLLRSIHLGYSNFQGDEIKAMCQLSDFSTLTEFLNFFLQQRKGPVQFLVTCALNYFDPTFSSEMALRLPFAVANMAALVCFFLLVWRLTSLQTAIYSGFLFATNGFFIAFARIVQYQSFVILASILGVFSLLLALQTEKWKTVGIYLGFVAAGIGCLAHFDAAFMLPPMLVLVFHWWRKYRSLPNFPAQRRHLFVALSIFVLMVAGFYAIYVLRLDTNQTGYWEERMNGETTDIFRLFQFYNPGPILWVCLGAVLLGMTRIRASLDGQIILAWVLPPLVFMSLVFRDSRTHAYTYILPLFLVAGLGVDVLVNRLRFPYQRILNKFLQVAVFCIFLTFSYISYAIFIDHTPEYPWSPKQVLGMNFQGGGLVGTFGFPYSRNWREIAGWFAQLPAKEIILVTNEKPEIAGFYLPRKVTSRYLTEEIPKKIRAEDGLYFLIVQKPQNWSMVLWGWPLDEWGQKLMPLQTFENSQGEVVASVYFLNQEQIKSLFPQPP